MQRWLRDAIRDSGFNLLDIGGKSLVVALFVALRLALGVVLAFFGVTAKAWIPIAAGFAGIFMVGVIREQWLLQYAKRQRYKAISDLADQLHDIEHQYASYTFLYHISDTKKDTWSRDAELVSNIRMPVVKQVHFGALSEGGSAVSALRKLKIRTYTNVGAIRVYPVDEDRTSESKTTAVSRRLKANLVFTKPLLPGETRVMSFWGQWDNQWKDLREKGKDRGRIEMIRDCDRLEIILTFPGEVDKARLLYCKTPKTVDPNDKNISRSRDRQGRYQLHWVIKNAKPGSYTFRVECATLPTVVEARKRRIRKAFKTIFQKPVG